MREYEKIKNLLYDIEKYGLSGFTIIFPFLPFGPPQIARDKRKELTKVLTPYVDQKKKNGWGDEYLSVFLERPRSDGPHKGEEYSHAMLANKIIGIRF